MSILNVGLVFGGVSPEHEVSVISTLQAAAALDRNRYRPVPVYIAKDGTWYTGAHLLDVEAYRDLDRVRARAIPVRLDPRGAGVLELVEDDGRRFRLRRPRRHRIDVMFLGLHGGSGENGGLQGLCETFNVPYTGSGILGSALGMDKVLSKRLCREAGIPVVDFVAFRESEWSYREEAWLDRCEAGLGYPVVVKPARLGSSIGITKAKDRAALDAAIEEAFRYDDKVIVERAVTRLREVNCSVLGDPDEAVPSVLEEPVTRQELLTFQEKYMRGEGGGGKGTPRRRGAKQGGGPGGMASLDRIIPAPLSDEQTRLMQELAVRVFRLFECAGVARIDFLLDVETGQVFFNEINTIPGSFSFYLWEPSGVSFEVLTHRLIELALKRHRDAGSRIHTYDVNLLSERSLAGLKGAKGSG
ncbi:MAG: D-alanine--D-alanine ligase [Rhodothermaceae bacterium]|nr:MAG: D-alanine--D-alanine ligase [Rhodothermaceae bacterium]